MTGSTTLPRLEVGKQAPNFTLPSVGGGEITRSSYRARKHLVLLFLPGVDLPAREYLEAVRDEYGEFRQADSEALVIVSDSGASAEGLRAAVDVPFPILLDTDGKATARFLPDGAVMGVIILDRYATVRTQWALTAPPFPPVKELVDWLYAVDRQCVL